MKLKPNVIIRMGASKFEAVVRHKDQVLLFDLRKMSRRDENTFRKELVFAFREAGLQAA